MHVRSRVRPLVILASLVGVLFGLRPVDARDLEIRKNDHIIILGNSFAERMHLFDYFETFLHSRFPDHQLCIRNMGWSADEVDKMIRPLGFPKLFDELELGALTPGSASGQA